MTLENIEKVRRIDFDRLNALVSERIKALKLYVKNIDKANGDPAVHDAICRDLVMPCVHMLAQFIEAVKVDVVDE